MTDLKLNRMLTAWETRQDDLQALEPQADTPPARIYAIAAYRAAEARTLRLQFIAQSRARYAATA